MTPMHLKRPAYWILFTLAAAIAALRGQAESTPARPPAPATVTVSPDQELGLTRETNGVNRGPADKNYQLDHTAAYRQLRIPSVRLHDCPFRVDNVADFHCIFPDPSADPDLPENYHFEATDRYLGAIREAGAEIYFRLGESIEHQPVKKYVRADRWDPERLARVCVNIVRHYNEGWKDGKRWGIRYWEIWNEPDLDQGRPFEDRRTWTGTPEQFYVFYKTIALALKAHDPSLKVGGASFAGSGTIQDLSNPYNPILRRWAAEKVPMDFYSWHTYLANWVNVGISARKVRAALDKLGWKDTESHLTEWGYLGRTAGGVTLFNAQDSRQEKLLAEALIDHRGARRPPVVFGVLARLQYLPVELNHYYTGDGGIQWGLFDPDGTPNNAFTAFAAFAEFYGKTRVQAAASDDSLAVFAAGSRTELLVGISSIEFSPRDVPIKVETAPGKGFRVRKIRQYSDGAWREPAGPTGTAGVFTVLIPGPSITLVELER